MEIVAFISQNQVFKQSSFYALAIYLIVFIVDSRIFNFSARIVLIYVLLCSFNGFIKN